MEKTDKWAVWNWAVKLGTVGCYVVILSFTFLVGAAFYHKVYTNGGISMTFWEVIINSVLPVAITGVVTVVVSYFVFLKKLPSEIAKALDKKMDPSNLSLQIEQHQMQNALNPSNAVLHEENKKLRHDHERIQDYLEATAQKQAVADERYKLLGTDSRTIVDAVQKLQGFSDLVQCMNKELMELRSENQKQRDQIFKLKSERDQLQQYLRRGRSSRGNNKLER